ncbi:MAG: hypothetical protein AAGC78_06260 [Cellvibrio sp.]|uniref:hypothetical protein n=1 Tax=Cellvibrio sp. TaxID=1965322 RepID=UPI0031B53462
MAKFGIGKIAVLKDATFKRGIVNAARHPIEIIEYLAKMVIAVDQIHSNSAVW